MNKRNRQSNRNRQYEQPSWYAKDEDYWNPNSGEDPETYIRRCQDSIQEAQVFLAQFQFERNKAARHNIWYSIKKYTWACVFWGAIVFLIGLFYVGHWIWGIIATYIFLGVFYEPLGFIYENSIKNDRKEDMTFHDTNIQKVVAVIELLQREIEIARAAARSNNAHNNAKGSYTNKNLFSRNTVNLTECYRILGCTPQASNEELKKTYHELMSELHPDRVRGNGNSNQLVKLAEEKVKEINAAYEIIKRNRGIS